jgi:predicted component of type VI protein secretion system
MALIKHTSALTLNVSGVFKDLLLIFYSVRSDGLVTAS